MTSSRTAHPADLDLPDRKGPVEQSDLTPAEPVPVTPYDGVILTPWPPASETRDRLAAIAVLRSDTGIGGSHGDVSTNDEVARIGEAASLMVEREAPSAPQAIRNEAVIRFAAYIYFTTKSQGFAKESLGPKAVEYATYNHAPAFRNCGAKGLLAPWKIRRAGAI